MDLRYNINSNGRILVWLISQTFPLGNADKNDKRKKLEEDDSGCCRDKDYYRLKEYFEKSGNFEAVVEFHDTINKSFECFQKEVKKIGQTKTEYQCFVFVFLTYSTPENKDGYNEEKLHFNHEDLETGLVPQAKIIDEIKNLDVAKGKPKVFLIQADDLTLLEEVTTTKAGPTEEVPKVIKIPKDSDQLIIKSTIPQQIQKDENKPSFLIQAFLEAMNDRENMDVFTLTTTINGLVANLIAESDSKRKSDMRVPLVTSTLTRLLYL